MSGKLRSDPVREGGEDHVVGVVAVRIHLVSVAPSGVESDSGGRNRMKKHTVRIYNLNSSLLERTNREFHSRMMA